MSAPQQIQENFKLQSIQKKFFIDWEFLNDVNSNRPSFEYKNVRQKLVHVTVNEF